MSILWAPNDGAQTAFLAATAREVLYGGAVGGGKTEALLTMPLRWASHPAFRAILLRRERRRLQETIDRSRELYPLAVPGALWHETELRWHLPAGGFIYMGSAEHEKDVEKFRTFQFNLVMFDELTEFTEFQYMYLFSRNRSASADLPLMMRSGTNPGGEGQAWVYKRFIENREPYRVYQHRIEVEGMADLVMTRQYIPSTVFDNPKLPNRDEYIAGLAGMDAETRDALLYGRWDTFRGQYFPTLPRETSPTFKHHEWYVIRCMDYGWGDPTSIHWLVVYPTMNVIEIVGEVYAPGMTTDSIASMIVQNEQAIFGQLGDRLRQSVLSPDAFNPRSEGAPSIADALSRAGVWFTKANNDRKNGWAQMLRLIARDQLRVWEGASPNFMRTLGRLPRDPLDLQDVKKRGVEDHAPEAVRYGLMAYVDEPQAVSAPAEVAAAPKDPFWEPLQKAIEAAEHADSWDGPWG